MDDKEKIAQLEDKIAQLEEELLATKEHLKKYTAPASNKVYYEKHKEEQKQRVKEYRKRTNYQTTPEQKKEYNTQAYLKRKEKLQNEIDKKHENI